jgi:hypothetical protein
MKTLFNFIISGPGGVRSFFFELDGDYRHLGDVYINRFEDDDKQDELDSIVYFPKSYEVKVNKLEEPTKDWDYFVKCGLVDYT